MGCSWAKTYPLMGHSGPILIRKGIWFICIYFFSRYSTDTYPWCIQRVSISDMYPGILYAMGSSIRVSSIISVYLSIQQYFPHQSSPYPLCRLQFAWCEGEPWHSSKVVALWPWGHGFKSWKQPLAEMQGKAAYIRPKVVGPFPRPCASRSYMHRSAPCLSVCLAQSVIFMGRMP
jgi:hypothetical protein